MVYVLLIIFLLLLSYIKCLIINKKYIDYLIIILMSVFYGIRYEVGRDFNSYMDMYYKPPGVEFGRIEFLYELLMKIFRFFNTPFWTFSIFVGIMIFVLIYLISKDNNIDYNVTILLFIITGSLFTSFNLVRQTLAGLIIMYALKYVYRKDLFKYLMLCIIATQFHKTTIIFLPFYFIQKIRLTVSNSCILLVVGLFLYFTNFLKITIDLIFHLVPLSYVNYIGGTFDYNVNPGLGVLFFILMNVIMILYKDNILENHPSMRPYLYVYIIGYSAGLITLQSFIFARLLDYCKLSVIFILPKLLDSIKNKHNIVLKVGIIIAYIFLFSVYLNSLETEKLIYKTILSMYN